MTFSDSYSNSEGWYKSDATVREVRNIKIEGDTVTAEVVVDETYRNINSSSKEEGTEVYNVEYDIKNNEIKNYRTKYTVDTDY